MQHKLYSDILSKGAKIKSTKIKTGSTFRFIFKTIIKGSLKIKQQKNYLHIALSKLLPKGKESGSNRNFIKTFKNFSDSSFIQK